MFELIAAPHTPMDDQGELNLGVVEAQASHFIATGVSGVFVAGSTGEGPSLSGTERRLLVERWAEVLRGRDELRLIVQVGHCSAREGRELARHAQDSGAAAVAASPPHWFPIRDTDRLVDVCAEIAGGAPDLPFLYYHIPALSGVDVPMREFLDQGRSRIQTLAGIKFTHADALDFQACMREHGDEVQLLWGMDEMLLTGLGFGARGAVGSTYNFLASLYHDLVSAWAEGDHERARGLQARSALLVETLVPYGYAAAAKLVMKFCGIDCGPVRPPLGRLEPVDEQAVRRDLERIGYFDWTREGARSV